MDFLETQFYQPWNIRVNNNRTISGTLLWSIVTDIVEIGCDHVLLLINKAELVVDGLGYC